MISVNNLNDYERFRQALEGKKRVTILGGGLIGCEFANDLGLADFDVEVMDKNALPLGHLVPQPVAERLLEAFIARDEVAWPVYCSVRK